MCIFRQGVLYVFCSFIGSLAYSSKIILMLECLGLKECEGKPKVNYVTVFERPGLREFLKQLSEFSELVLFTAGLEGIKITLPCFLDSLLPF